MAHDLAASRHPSSHGTDKADGIDFVAVVILEKPPGQYFKRLYLEPCLGKDGAAADGNLWLHRLVMLVLDLADDFLDQILDGDQAVDPAELVDHKGEMLSGEGAS